MLQRTTSVNARFIKGIDEGSYTVRHVMGSFVPMSTFKLLPPLRL